jgi:YQGE family putative transporter
MILSYALYLAAYPLIATFMNAYLWRSSGNLWSIVVYNLGYVIGIPVAFYINGKLLAKCHVLKLYFFGALLQAITPCLVLYFPSNGLTGLFVYGCMYGIGAGLFWGNKNYLDLQITRGTNRVYYVSIGQIFDLLMNVIIPMMAGWFIVLMTPAYITLSFTAYKIIMIVAFVLLFFSGLVMQLTSIKQIVIRTMILKKPKPIWGRMRLFNILFNVQVGTTLVLPNILILMLVGNEGILGTIQAITAGISAIAIYIIGRKSTISNAWQFILFGIVVFLIGTGILAGSFTWIGTLAYSVVITLTWASIWTPSYSVTMDLMDTLEPDTEKQYAYICDNEIFYNLGRGIGIAVICILAILINNHAALRYSALIAGLCQLPLALIIHKLVLHIHDQA